MSTNLARSDLMRRSVGDIISGFKTGADITNIEAEAATRQAELPFIPDLQRARIRALESGATLNNAQANEINRALDARIDKLTADAVYTREQAAALKSLTPAQKEKILAERKQIDAETQRTLDENKSLPVTIGDKTHDIPARLAGPILLQQEENRRIKEQNDRTYERLQRQHEDLQESRRRDDERADVAARDRQEEEQRKRDKDASDAESGIFAGSYQGKVTYSSDHPIMADRFNRISRQPYAIINTPGGLWGTKYRRVRLPIITKSDGTKIQLTPEMLYRMKETDPSPFKRSMTFDEYIKSIAKDMNQDIRSWYMD